MADFKLAIFVILTIVSSSHSAKKIQFYDDKNFEGLFHEIEVSQMTSSCEDLPSAGRQKLSSINTGGACIMLYEGTFCPSYISDTLTLRVGPNTDYNSDLSKVNFDNLTSSFRLCDEDKGGDQLNVLLYAEPNLKSDLVKYVDLCHCTNLPTFAANVTSVDNQGNCVKLHAQKDCTGQSVTLRGGKSSESNDLSTVDFQRKTASIGPCDNDVRPSCLQMTGEIFKFEVTFPTDENLAGAGVTSENMDLAPPIVYTNNATDVTTSYVYSAEQAVQEVVFVERVEVSQNGQLKDVSISEEMLEVTSDVSSIHLFGKGKIQKILKTAYSSEQIRGGVHLHEEGTRVGVNQNIEVPPCTQYTVSASAMLIHDHPMNYAVYTRVSGTFGGIPMDAMEVKQRLTLMDGDYVEDYDEFSVVIKSTSVMTASFVHATSVTGKEGEVAGCSATGGDGGATTIPWSTPSSSPPIDDGHNNCNGGYESYSKIWMIFILVTILITLTGVAVTVTQLLAVMSHLKASRSFEAGARMSGNWFPDTSAVVQEKR